MQSQAAMFSFNSSWAAAYWAAKNKNIVKMTSQWAQWSLKSPASRLFTQRFVQAQIKENIKAPAHWSLWRKFVGDWLIPRTKGQ